MHYFKHVLIWIGFILPLAHAVKNPRKCTNKAKDLALKIRIVCKTSDKRNCLDTLLEFDSEQCTSLPIKIQYKLINPNDEDIKVKPSSELLFANRSIFEGEDAPPSIDGLVIQAETAHKVKYNTLFDTCKYESLPILLRLQVKSTRGKNDKPGESYDKKTANCYTEKNVVVKLMNISNGTMTEIPSASPTTIKFDVKPDDPSIIPSTDTFSPSSMPSSNMPSKPGQTKSPKSERPSVSIRPSLDPVESPSFAPSISDVPSKSGKTKSPKSERPSVSIGPSLDPVGSPSSMPSISNMPSKQGKTKSPKSERPSVNNTLSFKKECKKKPNIKIPKRCKGIDSYVDARVEDAPQTKVDSMDAEESCKIAFEESKFDEVYNSTYLERQGWFDENSILNLPDVGAFKGLNEITNYLGFIQSPELFTFKTTNLEGTSFTPIKTIVATEDQCIVTYATVASVTINGSTASLSMDVVFGGRTAFSIDEVMASGILVARNDVYFPDAYSEKFWGRDGLGTQEVAATNCKIMTDSCTFISDANCYSDVKDCELDMLAIPRIGKYGNADQKNMACRTFYASLASKDVNQCQHISWEPKFDADCNMRCQDTKHYRKKSISNYFGKEENYFFKEFSKLKGFDEDSQFRIKE